MHIAYPLPDIPRHSVGYREMSNSAAHCLGDTARYIYIYFSCCFGTTGNFNHRRKKPPPSPPPCATVWPTLRARFPALSLSLSHSCQLLRLILVVVNVVFDVFVCNQWKIYDNTHNRTHTTAHTHTYTRTPTKTPGSIVAASRCLLFYVTSLFLLWRCRRRHRLRYRRGLLFESD